jgi:hypothetical protein
MTFAIKKTSFDNLRMSVDRQRTSPIFDAHRKEKSERENQKKRRILPPVKTSAFPG